MRANEIWLCVNCSLIHSWININYLLLCDLLKCVRYYHIFLYIMWKHVLINFCLSQERHLWSIFSLLSFRNSCVHKISLLQHHQSFLTNKISRLLHYESNHSRVQKKANHIKATSCGNRLKQCTIQKIEFLIREYSLYRVTK